jgi:hypothetical protein
MLNIHTKNAVTRFAYTLGAEVFDVRLIDATDQSRTPVKVSYTIEQLTNSKTMLYLAGMNKERYHIYCRPVGYRYILLDDLSRDKLQELASFKPCLLVETSSRNYQAWLKLEEEPTDRIIALDICRQLATYFQADMNAAKPEQVGRLPGYTNCKEKYRKANGQFDFVKLWRWKDRFATLHPLEGAACKKTVSTSNLPEMSRQRYVPGMRSQSEADFALACQMIREGKSDLEIVSCLEENLLLPGRTRKTKNYIPITIANAHQAVSKSKMR